MAQLKNNFELSILKYLKEGLKPIDISKKLNVSLPRLSYYLTKLKNKNIIEKKGLIYLINPVKTLNQDTNFKLEDSVRGHAFIWKIRFQGINKIDWKSLLESKQINYDEVNLGTPRIILNNNKIWLGKKNIIIYLKDSIFGQTTLETRKFAIQSLLDELKSLREYLDIPPFKNLEFTCAREHFSLIKNILAIQCNKNNEKIKIFNEKGQWLEIDDSFNLGELENNGSIQNNPFETNRLMQKWWNENKETNFKVTPSFLLENFNKLIEDRAYWAKHQISHVASIQNLGSSTQSLESSIKKLDRRIDSLSKVMKGVLIENQNLKLSSKHQTTLGDFK